MEIPNTVSLSTIRSNWNEKERSSVKCNRLLIKHVRITLHGDEHHDDEHEFRCSLCEYRGPEDMWYWTWDIICNRRLAIYRYLSLTQQPRITHITVDDEGFEQKRWRIPDFAIVRHASERVIERDGIEILEGPFFSYVALGEIKPAPIDDSVLRVKEAVSEARNDLKAQIDIYFDDNSEAEAIVGISVAGDWWTFEVFKRTDYPFDEIPKHDDSSYIPSSDMDIDSSIILSSDRDELDIISRDGSSDEAESFLHNDQDQDEAGLQFFQLLELNSDFAFGQLINTIRHLPGYEEFRDFPF